MTTGVQTQELNTEALQEDVISKDLGLVKPEEISAESAVDAELEQKADQIIDKLINFPATDEGIRARSKSTMENYGLDLQKEAALQSDKLKDPIKKLSCRSEEGGEVAQALINLRMQVEELDPARVDLSPGFLSRLLGYLPGVGTPMKRYFMKYESAQTVINAVIDSLELGREQLKRDNITLSGDQQRLRESTGKITKAIQLAQIIDRKLQTILENEVPPDRPAVQVHRGRALVPTPPAHHGFAATASRRSAGYPCYGSGRAK